MEKRSKKYAQKEEIRTGREVQIKTTMRLLHTHTHEILFHIHPTGKKLKV